MSEKSGEDQSAVVAMVFSECADNTLKGIAESAAQSRALVRWKEYYLLCLKSKIERFVIDLHAPPETRF